MEIIVVGSSTLHEGPLGIKSCQGVVILPTTNTIINVCPTILAHDITNVTIAFKKVGGLSNLEATNTWTPQGIRLNKVLCGSIVRT